MSVERVEIRIYISKSERGTKWRVRINGVSSGFVVHNNDIDDNAIVFGLDASRFRPVVFLNDRRVYG